MTYACARQAFLDTCMGELCCESMSHGTRVHGRATPVNENVLGWVCAPESCRAGISYLASNVTIHSWRHDNICRPIFGGSFMVCNQDYVIAPLSWISTMLEFLNREVREAPSSLAIGHGQLEEKVIALGCVFRHGHLILCTALEKTGCLLRPLTPEIRLQVWRVYLCLAPLLGAFGLPVLLSTAHLEFGALVHCMQSQAIPRHSC